MITPNTYRGEISNVRSLGQSPRGKYPHFLITQRGKGGRKPPCQKPAGIVPEDRQTDGRTYDNSIYRASIASRGKNFLGQERRSNKKFLSHGIFLSFAETAVRQTITASIKFHGILYASVMPHDEHALDLLFPVEIRNAIESRSKVMSYCDDKWLLRNATLFSDVIERRQVNVNREKKMNAGEPVSTFKYRLI